MQTSFASLELEQRINRQGPLQKANTLIRWEELRPLLAGLYKREVTETGAMRDVIKGGQKPFDPIMMFKAILLGQWHSLSDPKLEEALLVRIDFLQFCGLGLNDPIPDESTLCRFRNRLVKAGKLEALLSAVNTHLQGHGVMMKNAPAAVVNATLIVSAARPKKEHVLEVH